VKTYASKIHKGSKARSHGHLKAVYPATKDQADRKT